MNFLARFGLWKSSAVVGGLLAVGVVIGARSIKTVEVPKPPVPTPYVAPAPAPAVDPKSLLAVPFDGGPGESLTAGSAHALVTAAIDDGARVAPSGDERTPGRAPTPAPVAILACEEELAAVREMSRDPESFRHVTGALTRLHARLTEVANSSAGEWKLAAMVLMGECVTELAERSEALSPSLCNEDNLSQVECAELMEEIEGHSSRQRAAQLYRNALAFAETEGFDTAYSRLAKSRLGGK